MFFQASAFLALIVNLTEHPSKLTRNIDQNSMPRCLSILWRRKSHQEGLQLKLIFATAPETLKESRLSSEGWTKSSAKPSKKSKHARMQNARPKCRERSKNGLLIRRGPFKRERRLRPRSEQSKKNKLDSKRHEKTTERGSSHK